MAFTWTCGMFIPPNKTSNVIRFMRNDIQCVYIALSNTCTTLPNLNPRYTYKCLSNFMYSLTIPSENMTEFEQNSKWKCISVIPGYGSPEVTLQIASKK